MQSNLPDTNIFEHNLQQCNENKPIIDHCASLSRLMIALNYYNTLDITNQKTDEYKLISFCNTTYKGLLNDYIHLMNNHQHDLYEINQLFIEKYSSFKCNNTIHKCELALRHYRDRRHHNTENEHKQAFTEPYRHHFYVDIFDSIHFYVLHLYDSGMRIKTEDIEHCIKGDCFDIEFSKLQKLIKQKSTNNTLLDVSVHNKFNIEYGIKNADDVEEETFVSAMLSQCNQDSVSDDSVHRLSAFMKEEEYDTDSIIQDMDTVDQPYLAMIKLSNLANIIQSKQLFIAIQQFVANNNSSSSSFSIGLIFYYWKYYKHNRSKKKRRKTERSDWTNVNDHSGYNIKELYVEQRYKTLKEELLSSVYISVSDFDGLIMEKAEAFMNTETAKKTHAAGGDWMRFLHYDISAGTPLSISNVICIIVYCDFGKLCSDFTSTFRPIKSFESLSSIKRRNQQYWWLSKVLRETVQVFGDNKEGRKYGDGWVDITGPFYCGMNFVMAIPEFNIRLCSPTSTSKHITVATSFGGDKGMIIQVNNNGDAVSARYLRCFQCSWLSKYTEEEEYLFFGGDYRIRIESIRNIETCKNFQAFIKPLFYFDEMINGSDPHGSGCDTISKKEELVLSLLIQNEVFSVDNDMEPYVMDTFRLFCMKKTQIIINLTFMDLYFKALYPLIMNPIERSNKNWKIATSSKNLFQNVLFTLFINIKEIVIYSTPSMVDADHSYSFSLYSLYSLIKDFTDRLRIKIFAKHHHTNSRSWLFDAYNNRLQNLYNESIWNIELKVISNARGEKEDYILIKNRAEDMYTSADEHRASSVCSISSSRRVLTVQSNTHLFRQKFGGIHLTQRKRYQGDVGASYAKYTDQEVDQRVKSPTLNRKKMKHYHKQLPANMPSICISSLNETSTAITPSPSSKGNRKINRVSPVITPSSLPPPRPPPPLPPQVVALRQSTTEEKLSVDMDESGWIMLKDMYSGKMYWRNLKTEKIRWESPHGTYGSNQHAQHPTYIANDSYQKQQSTRPYAMTTVDNMPQYQSSSKKQWNSKPIKNLPTKPLPALPKRKKNITQNEEFKSTLDPVAMLGASKWKQTKDLSTGNKYWFHKDTKKTTWSTPHDVLKVSAHVVVDSLASMREIEETDWEKRSDIDLSSSSDYTSDNTMKYEDDEKQSDNDTASVDNPNTPQIEQDEVRRLYLKPRSLKDDHESLADDNPWIAAHEAKSRVIVRDTTKRYWQIGAGQAFKMEDWAKNHYQLDAHKKGLFGQKQRTIVEIMSYTEFNKLKKPLYETSDDEILKQQCMQMWKNINSYIGARKSRKPSEGHVLKLIKCAMKGDDRLRNEIYSQTIKQTTHNASWDMELKGWQLLLICCSFFPPSDNFVDYVSCYIWNNSQRPNEIGQYAVKALHALDATMSSGTRKYAPLPLEIVNIENLEPIPLNIYFINGMKCKQILVTSQTRARQVMKTLTHVFNLKYPQAMGLYEMQMNLPSFDKMKRHYYKRDLMSQHEKINDLLRLPFERELEDNDRMLDVIASWFKRDTSPSKKKRKQVFQVSKDIRFVIKVKIYRKSMEVELNSMGAKINFLTHVSNVVHGLYPMDDDEEIAFDLAALELQGTYGRNAEIYKPGLITYDLDQYLCRLMRKKYNKIESERRILELRANKYNDLCRCDCWLKYAKMLRTHKKMQHYFGSTWYRGVRIDDEDVKSLHLRKSRGESMHFRKDRNQSDLLIGINEDGIVFVNPVTQNIVERYGMNEILTFGSRSNAFLFVSGSLMSQKKIQIATMNGKSMNRLVQAQIRLRIRKPNSARDLKTIPQL